MKLICECGNEMEFNTVNLETGEKNPIDDRGQFATTDFSKFSYWAEHDIAGFECSNCKEAVWFHA